MKISYEYEPWFYSNDNCSGQLRQHVHFLQKKKKKKPLHEEMNMTFAVAYFATHLNI